MRHISIVLGKLLNLPQELIQVICRKAGKYELYLWILVEKFRRDPSLARNEANVETCLFHFLHGTPATGFMLYEQLCINDKHIVRTVLGLYDSEYICAHSEIKLLCHTCSNSVPVDSVDSVDSDEEEAPEMKPLFDD